MVVPCIRIRLGDADGGGVLTRIRHLEQVVLLLGDQHRIPDHQGLGTLEFDSKVAAVEVAECFSKLIGFHGFHSSRDRPAPSFWVSR
jgi:hypothetical protein